MWLRTTDSAVQKLKANFLPPLEQFQERYWHLYSRYEGLMRVSTVMSGMNTRKTPGDHVGYIHSLSTFYEIKGIQFEETELIVYDEVNREKGERNFDL